MKLPVRVGIIEIGSRSLRLLIAEVAAPPHFHVLTTDSKESRLAQTEDLDEIEESLSRIAAICQKWMGRCVEMGVMNPCLFGTEGLRRLPAESVQDLAAELPGLRVLNADEEAVCSLLAAGYGLPVAEQNGTIVVIDQGGASLEVAVGEYVDGKLRLKSSKSLPLGTQPLVAMLQEAGGSLGKLKKKLAAEIELGDLKSGLGKARVIIQGSAATKLAWMSVRQQADERYDPRRVQGVRAPAKWIDGLTATAQSDPDRVRRAVDPKNPAGSEYETVMAGLVALRVLLEELGAADFSVGSLGTRHGMAWMLAGLGGRAA
ncbi:MAG TPA: hypothetical protein VGE39_09755 [Prosthecobacter sp.]